MGRIKFNPEISISHLIVAASLLVSVVLYTAEIKTSINEEAYARDTADKVFAERMENITRILSDIEARVNLNDIHRLTDEARWSD